MNLGPAEILVVLVIALIVFGPKKLPEVGRQVGAAVRELRKMQDTVKSELSGVLDPDAASSSTTTSAADVSDAVDVDTVDEPDHTSLPAPPSPEPEADVRFEGPSGSFS
jgi:sec-independent protein translocase protein TatA